MAASRSNHVCLPFTSWPSTSLRALSCTPCADSSEWLPYLHFAVVDSMKPALSASLDYWPLLVSSNLESGDIHCSTLAARPSIHRVQLKDYDKERRRSRYLYMWDLFRCTPVCCIFSSPCLRIKCPVALYTAGGRLNVCSVYSRDSTE